jgi:hypothetical protein
MIAYARIAGLMIAVALSGCATTAGNNAAKPAATATASKDPTCLQDTGSRITSPGSKCRGIGSSYSSDDIDRTGSTSAAEALRLLDPAVTAHH